MESIKRGGNIVAQYTENYNLELQQGADFINVNGLNTNFNTIDGELKNLEDNKAPKEHKHKTSDITDFPAKLPADGGDADTVGGKSADDFRLTNVSIVSNKDYNSFTNGTVYAATGCANSPDNYCIVETNVAPNGDGYQKAYCVNTRITYNRKRATVDGWTTWMDNRDGGNAYTLSGKGVTDFVQNYKQVANGTSILAWAESVANVHNIVTARIQNPPDPPTNYGYIAGDCDFWVTAYSLSTNKDYIQLEIRDIRSNSVFRNNKLAGVWRGWDSTNDGGNAHAVDGLHLGVLPQATYDALATKNPNTIYFTV